MNSKAPLVEFLEPRIAPAAMVLANGANLLSAGDQGTLSEADSSSEATTLVKCSAGKALVFWDSTAREIKGISVSDGASIEILGDIKGDIVTNLESSGFLSDSDNNPANGLDGGKLLAGSIAGIKTNAYFDSRGNAQNGDVGRIIAGGSISNVVLNGDLKGVFAGDGIFDATASETLPNSASAPTEGGPNTRYDFKLGMDFDPSGYANLSTMPLKMSNASFLTDASISNVSFASGINVQFFAGDGALGASGGPGGSIAKITFVGAIADESATGFFEGKSYVVSAGDGGHSSTNGNGGPGGSVTGVSESGSGGKAYLHAGQGGDGSGARGMGGVGGSVSNLDLQGAVIAYDIRSGDGGFGTVGGAGGAVTNTNIASKGPISLAGPFLGIIAEAPVHKDFFIINRSTGDMTLIDGSTFFGEPIIPAKAAGPLDAIANDLNGDGYLDVAVVYADGTLGILLNNAGDGTFDYTVKDLGFKPFKILSGDFVGDAGNPELAIISTNKLQTTIRLYSAADPTNAANFVSDTTKFKPLILKIGNLADAAGGDPAGLYGYAMQLNPEEARAQSDLVLGFAAGTLHGVVSQGSGTGADPFYFATRYANPDTTATQKFLNAPKAYLVGGIRDIDFNFAGSNPASQTLAVVNASGTSAKLVVIGKAAVIPPVEGEPIPVASDQFVFNVKEALPLPTGAGTLLQAAWTNTYPLQTKTDLPTARLMLLASSSTASSFLIFGGYGGEPGKENMGLQAQHSTDFLINSVANNFQFSEGTISSSGRADSYIFTTGYVTMALAYQGVMPVGTKPPVLAAFALPFAGKDVKVHTGDGGGSTTGAAGKGGDIRSLNFDSNFATVTTGKGGVSASGACGNGGSVFNAAAFRTSSALITPSMAVTDILVVTAGNGGTSTGSGSASRGGHGGSISGVSFNTTGHYVGMELIRGDIELVAGKGGNSESLDSGNGGSILATTITNARNVTLSAGAGGIGTVGAKASGGNGGSVVSLLGGDTKNTGARRITGNVIAAAGIGGNSANARAGNGGDVSTVAIGNMATATAKFDLTAGKGGDSAGTDKSSNAGAGGSIVGVTAERLLVNPNMTAGNGGDAVNGSGGAGGAIQNLVYEGGLLNLASGLGGNSFGAQSTGSGGIGGAIIGIKAKINGSGYMTFEAGRGGNGVGASGGAGGAILNTFFQLNPDDRSAGDETLGLTVKSGFGGNGSRGGAGGLISGVSCDAVYDNAGNDGFTTVIDSIAMRIVAGMGGTGSNGDGGAGGAIAFSKALIGISQIDEHSTKSDFLPGEEALRVVAGDGGSGTAKGGAGGAVTGLKAANARTNNLGDPIPMNLLAGAFVRSGDGGDGTYGDGGAGGTVTSTRLAVERQQNEPTGNIHIFTGAGGASVAGKGGAGGWLQDSLFTAVNGSNAKGYGILLQTGDGGDGGKAGGAGGNLFNTTVSVPSAGINGSADGTSADIYGAVLIAGNGGKGVGMLKSTGGVGGSLFNINQQKDVFGVINLLQAGSGGNSSADSIGASGGSISKVRSQGYLGAPMAGGLSQGLYNSVVASDTIDSLIADKHQGVFAGLGGSGSTRGLNGSVTGISAPAIAAIAAADRDGVFEQATVVSKIASLYHPGFDVDKNGDFSLGDGYVLAAKFDPVKELVSLDPKVVTTANLIMQAMPFVNPVP